MAAIIELLQSNNILFIILVGLFSLLVGSFLNVVIYRLPLMMQREWRAQCAELAGNTPEQADTFNLNKPRSHCPKCNTTIRAWQNIPVLSYLLLRGKCKICQHPISIRYPSIEALTALLSMLVAFHFGVGWTCLAALLLTWSLLALTFIDVDHQLLPDNLTLPLLWLGLFANLFGLFTDLRSAVIGALAGYLILWLVYQAFKLATGKEGMGYGDFKLLAALGAWLGWQYLPAILILSSLVGAIIGGSMILIRRHQSQIPIPFGPYLACAGFIALLWGDKINTAYQSWAGIL
jgi:leader peptidase (prepilin peptidase)/N-methyltransferase